MPRFLIISHSASKLSRSRQCIAPVVRELEALDYAYDIVDIRDLPPAWIDSRGLEGLPKSYAALDKRASEAHGIFFIGPIYCYTASSPMKMISEAINTALTYKPVAFVISAGTVRSHLGVSDIASSMAFEQSTFCYPKHMMVTYDDFLEGQNDLTLREDALKRLKALTQDFVLFCEAIAYFNANSIKGVAETIATAANGIHLEPEADGYPIPAVDFRVNHLNICVSDLETSLRFYKDVFRVRYLRSLGPKKAVTDFNGFEFYIEEVADPSDHPLTHFGVRTTRVGVLAFASHLDRLGVALVRGNGPLRQPHLAPDQERTALYFRDPDGLLIEVYSPEAEQLAFERAEEKLVKTSAVGRP